MAEHKFKIGQAVYFHPKKSKLVSYAPPGPHQIIRRLPAMDGEFQYVIRSAHESHERVAREKRVNQLLDDRAPANVAGAASRCSWIAHVNQRRGGHHHLCLCRNVARFDLECVWRAFVTGGLRCAMDASFWRPSVR